MVSTKKKILIFGSEGQLGFDLCRVLKKEYQVVPLNRKSADVTNESQVAKIISEHKPDFIINATAYNKVDRAEIEVETAFKVNALGPWHLAKSAADSRAVFVHISTDYVFDGSKNFFVETDYPNPLNVYGASKLAGEQLIKIAGPRFYLIRTSAVFGEKQSSQKLNFVDKILQSAQEGKDLKVVDDLITSPTYSLDLANKIKELLQKPAAFGIYHITNSGSCSWFEFAAKIAEMAKLNVKVLPISFEQSGSKIIKPKLSVLKNQALLKAGLPPMPAWQDALARYLAASVKGAL